MSRVLRFITFNGETHTVSEWERRLALSRGTVFNRLRGGWPLEDALTITANTSSYRLVDPAAHQPKRIASAISFNGRTMSLTEWAKHLELNVSTLRNRFRSGWPIEDALTITQNTSLYAEVLKSRVTA